MFDNLIRHDPRDSGKTIIPDLAHSWEISKDGKSYTFFLRKGVLFHDGAELTADDVKATFDRIRNPPQGVTIPRSILFKAVSEITAPDKYTVQFKLAAPRPASLHHGGDRQRLEHHPAQEDAGREQLQSAQGGRPIPAPARSRPRQARRERSMGDGEEQGLLEQGSAVSRRHRVLQSAPVLARTRRGDPVQPCGLCPHRRSGDRAQGQGHARHVHHRVQPERDPGNLDQRQEEAVR